jgi:peptidylprolyl isomerase
MEQAHHGDTVKVHYIGTLDDGTLFDSSAGRDPLRFTIGGGLVLPGFEEAVVGMTPGQSKQTTIAAADAYGPRFDEMIVSVEKENLPDDVELEVGQQLQLNQPDGRALLVQVAEVGDTTIVLDANHPLAGSDLNFEIRLIEIVQNIA